MQLHIIPTDSKKLHVAFGIADERKDYLTGELKRISEAMAAIGNGPHRLHEYYNQVAELCDTIEEYTVCMHLFVFFLANNGDVERS